MSIIAGYDSAVQFQLTGITLPSDATFRAAIREPARGGARNSGALLTTLRTEDDTITLDVSGAAPVLSLIVAGSASAAWTVNEVWLDIVRTDTATDQHLGFWARARVDYPLTPPT